MFTVYMFQLVWIMPCLYVSAGLDDALFVSAGLDDDIDEELAAAIAAKQDTNVKFEEKGQVQPAEVPMSPTAMAVMNRLTE